MDLALQIVIAVVGIGLIVFAHELGHFLAAKRSGVKVERFSLGFDPRIFGVRMRLAAFRRGETEYVIGAIPFGGYVKLCGEGLDEEAPVSRESLQAQPIGRRAVIFAAGGIMNIIFGFLLFIVAFKVGVSFIRNSVGRVEYPSPAWDAGLRPGDALLAIDGKAKEDFTTLLTTIALRGTDEPIHLTVGRRGQRLEVPIKPVVNPAIGIPSIGIDRPISMEIRSVAEDSPAEQSGIRPGDRILSVETGVEGGGVHLGPDIPEALRWEHLTEFTEHNPGKEVRLELARRGRTSPEWVSVRVGKNPRGPSSRFLGVALRVQQVIACRGAAASWFVPGDEIVAIDGVPVETLRLETLCPMGAGGDETVEITIAGREDPVRFRRTEIREWIAAGDLIVGQSGTYVLNVRESSPAEEIGITAGDKITHVGGTPLGRTEAWEEALGSAGGGGSGAVTIRWLRAGAPQERSVKAEDARTPEAMGIRWDRRVILGQVTRGAPGEGIGLRPGDRIITIGGTEIEDWPSLVRAVHQSEGSVKIEWEREGERHAAETALDSPRGYLGLLVSEDRYTRVASLLEACSMAPEHTVLWIQNVFLTIRGLIRREVSAKNVIGPVGLIDTTRRIHQYGTGTFLHFLALISINLGIINLFPIPILDGGHLLFLGIEKAKGSPVSERVQYWAHVAAFLLIVSVALLVTFNDIARAIYLG